MVLPFYDVKLVRLLAGVRSTSDKSNKPQHRPSLKNG